MPNQAKQEEAKNTGSVSYDSQKEEPVITEKINKTKIASVPKFKTIHCFFYYCPKCEADAIVQDSNFCPNCGVPIEFEDEEIAQ